ncbi:MAG: transglutaminase domain-containing protein [Deltaproteobacteria bacterium]|nr:transglutaminase domain-containing protein [Deltaproteobacteria bacterium]
MRKGPLIKIVIGILIIASWAGMMFLLVEKEGLIKGDFEKTTIREFMPEDIQLDIWKGIYIKDRWVGYLHTILAPWKTGYRVHSRSYLRFKMFNQTKTLSIMTIQQLDPDYHLVNFQTTISGLAGIILKGERLGNQLLVEIMYGDTTFKKTFDLKDDLFLDQSILQIYRGKGLKVGDSYTLSILNPLTLNTEEVLAEVVGKEDGDLVMETKFAGLVSRSWINRDGLVVREETPNGWVMKIEDRKTIEKHLAESEGDSVDLLKDVSVSTKRKLKNPRETYFMKIKVTGVDLKNFNFDGKRQKLIDPDAGIIEISPVFPPAKDVTELSREKESLGEFLRPSIWIDSNDPAIRAKAAEIAGNEKNRWNVAKKIGEWVYKNIEKSFTPEVPVATSVLKSRRGDCNEHTVLFVALARACGIPAEMCAGLVYLNDGFYYHAWPKVFVGKWVHLDPALGQDIADATHFELVSGGLSSQAKIVLAIGNINIEILKAAGSGH